MKNSTKKTLHWKKGKLYFYATISVIIFFIFFECLFRIIFSIKNYGFHNTVHIQGNTLQVSDDTLVFKNRAYYLDYKNKYQFNEEGMKSAPGDEFITVKMPQDYWVLLTGASAMEGMGSNRNGDWLDITGIEDHPYNKSISYYLQELLQKGMPDKKIKVFNAAFSSSTIYQSYWRYMLLAKKLKPDWVISMDAQNDPSTISPGENTKDMIKQEWELNPQFHYPLKLIIPLTSNSAFINAIKQYLFQAKQNSRLQIAKNNNFPLRHKWAYIYAPPIKIDSLSNNIKRAVDTFSMWLLKYDSTLNSCKQKHLLLLQPHMFLRDTGNLSEVEKAVNHYYRVSYQDSKQHAFLNEVYKRFSVSDSLHKNIVSMTAVDHWPEWIFVDYCHFSDEATLKIAKEIYIYIMSDGQKAIFKNKGE